MPSFVGRKISDVFFHRNRLGLVSDENVIMSRTGDYFNFFRGTNTAVLDDDPIDVGVSHTKVSLIRHAVPFAETLLLFSDQTQFQLAKTDILTPNTVSIDQATEYECSLRAKPVGIGRHVYFTVNRGKFTGVKEYYLDAATEVLDAAEITGHVLGLSLGMCSRSPQAVRKTACVYSQTRSAMSFTSTSSTGLRTRRCKHPGPTGSSLAMHRC